jgi:hypothetical protein
LHSPGEADLAAPLTGMAGAEASPLPAAEVDGVAGPLAPDMLGNARILSGWRGDAPALAGDVTARGLASLAPDLQIFSTKSSHHFSVQQRPDAIPFETFDALSRACVMEVLPRAAREARMTNASATRI